MIKCIISNIRSSLWRWLLIIVLFAGISCKSYNYIEFNNNSVPIFYEIILDQMNDIIMVCFILSFAWYIIIGDINRSWNQNLKKTTSIYSETFHLFVYILLINLILLCILILVNLVLYFINAGSNFLFINEWIKDNELKNRGLNPFSSCIISIILNYLRFVFLSLLIYTVNQKSKNQFGVIIAIFINIIDWIFYRFFQIYEQLYILPIEHTSILFSNINIPKTNSFFQISYIISVLYWVILIIITLIIIYFQTKYKKDKRIKENDNN